MAIHKAGGVVAFDVGGDDEFGLDQFDSPSEAGSDSQGLNSEPSGGWVPWEQLQQEILDAFIQDEDSVKRSCCLKLAARRLRSDVQDLLSVLERTDPGMGHLKRLNRAFAGRADSEQEDINWDALEDAGSAEVDGCCGADRTMKTSELLAIAQVANRANRRAVDPMKNHSRIPHSGEWWVRQVFNCPVRVDWELCDSHFRQLPWSARLWHYY